MRKRQKITTSWKRSTQVRKQRKYIYRAPLHLKQKLMHSHLAKELRLKYHGLRRIQVRKGDKVKVARGEFRGKDGKIERITLKDSSVYVSGMDRIKADGSKVPVAFHPSNLVIVELDLSDKKRKEKLNAEKNAGKSESSSSVGRNSSTKNTPTTVNTSKKGTSSEHHHQ